MGEIVKAAEVVTLVAFVALALVCVSRWRSRYDRATKWAGVTFGLLALVLVAGRFTPETGDGVVEWARKLTIALLVAFPYCLYRFTTAFEQRHGRGERGIAMASAALVLVTLLLPYIPASGDPRPRWFDVYLVVFLGLWTLASLLAAVRLWRAGRQQPAVVRARLRVLSLGSVGLSLALIVAPPPRAVAWSHSSQSSSSPLSVLCCSLSGSHRRGCCWLRGAVPHNRSSRTRCEGWYGRLDTPTWKNSYSMWRLSSEGRARPSSRVRENPSCSRA